MVKINLGKKYRKILNAKRNRRGRSRDPLSNAADKTFDASNLIEEVHKQIKNRRLIQEARRQFVITSVTSIEVLLKDYFLKLLTLEDIIDKFPEYTELKYSIADIDFLEENQISNEELVLSQYNFQDLSEIDKAFSTVLSNKFFDEFKTYKWWFDKKDKKHGFIILKDFYKKLEKLINLRHDFVHDIIPNFKLHKNEINEIDEFCIYFIHILSFYMEDKIKELKKNKSKN